MMHLTISQILQTVDGTADYATQAAVTSHLAVCQPCRAEVDFQRSLLRAARRLPPLQVSGAFTSKVMVRILPKRQNAIAAWVLNNMGNVFAMMVVLAVLTFVLTSPTPLVGMTENSPGQVWVQDLKKGMEDGYTKFTSLLQRGTPVVEHTSRRNGTGPESKLVIIILSLVVLGLADKFLLSRMKARPRA